MELNKLLRKHYNLMLLIKAIGYRLWGTLATIIISFIFTGNVKISVSIGICEVISKIILYYIYEKMWEKIFRNKNEENL